MTIRTCTVTAAGRTHLGAGPLVPAAGTAAVPGQRAGQARCDQAGTDAWFAGKGRSARAVSANRVGSACPTRKAEAA